MRGLFYALAGLAVLGGGGAAYYFLVYKADRNDVNTMIEVFNRAGSDVFVGLNPVQLQTITKGFMKLSKEEIKFLTAMGVIPEQSWTFAQSQRFRMLFSKGRQLTLPA